MDFLQNKRVAVIGHTFGIGKEIYEICKFNKAKTVDGFSRSNGYNILHEDANPLISKIIKEDYDIVFNNVFAPKLQTKVLKVLHQQWKDRSGKVVINTGSCSAYYSIGAANYEHDKLEQADYCIAAGRDYPSKNKCRLHNVSLGWVRSNLTEGIDDKWLLDTYEVALILVNLVNDKPYIISEMVVNSPYPDDITFKRMATTARLNASASLQDSIDLVRVGAVAENALLLKWQL